jgi:two-component system cell cycle sensor histidine kinase/response regulator CckA
VRSALDADSPPPDIGSGTKIVLIVDDIWIARRTAARFLTAAGYRVYEADSAEEALEVLQQLGGRVDLVLTDVVMPNFNGAEFARRLAQEWPATRVLFMSAYSALVLDQYGMDLALPFIEKPFTAESLIYKVAEVLSDHQETGTETPRAS